MEFPSPHDRSLDSTLALLREGYLFGAHRFERLGSDLFVTRLLGEEVAWIRGPEAVEVFYDEELFTRAGAVPRRIRRTLIGEGTVQTLDGAAHRARKAALLGVLTPIRAAELTELIEHAWLAALPRWTRAASVDLLAEAQTILCRAACDWAGVPLASAEAPRRAEQLAALIDALGGVGPRHWRGRIARRSLEGWLSGQVEAVRDGRLLPAEGRALATIAGLRDEAGAQVDARTAAAELINLLRPIVAIARYVVFAAQALHEHPECRLRLRTEGGGYARQFAQELRRFYPLAPCVAARVRVDLSFAGHRLRAGTLVLLDIFATHRDPRCWPHADEFVPERFAASGAEPLGFIPQGGGDPQIGHRCAGEAATLEIVMLASRLLAEAMEYEVPAQEVDLERIPALARGRFVIRRVRSTVNFDAVGATGAMTDVQDMRETTGVVP